MVVAGAESLSSQGAAGGAACGDVAGAEEDDVGRDVEAP